MAIRTLMRTELVSILPHVSLDAAFALMREHGFHHFPVVNGKMELIGILSDRDILRGALSRRKTEWSQVLVQDLFTRNPITIAPHDSVQHAATLMVRNRISSLPVCDNGRVVGIVTHFDLLGVLADRQ